MMALSKGIGIDQGGWGWKSLVISAGAVVWCVSQVGQLFWNTRGAFATIQEVDLAEEFQYPLSACLWSSDQLYSTTACSELYDTIANIIMGLGLLSIWWNPRLKEKLRRENGRILGLQEFYKLQIIFLVVRTVSWAVLVRPQDYGLDARAAKAAHSFMLVFVVLVSELYQNFIAAKINTVYHHLFPNRSIRLFTNGLVPR